MEYQDCQRRFKDAQKLMNKAKAELNQVMKYTIEDWRENNRQLNPSICYIIKRNQFWKQNLKSGLFGYS